MKKTERTDRSKSKETRGFFHGIISVSDEISKKRNFRQF